MLGYELYSKIEKSLVGYINFILENKNVIDEKNWETKCRLNMFNANLRVKQPSWTLGLEVVGLKM